MTRKILGLAALLAALLIAPAVRADEVKDTVTKLLATRARSQVILEFDLKRTDGVGGTAVKLQGTVVGADGLVLVTSASQVDPLAGSAFGKPTEFKVRFPGDKKVSATFVGKDDELNLALVRLDLSSGDLPEFHPTLLADAAGIVPGEQLIVLKRLGRGDEDAVTFGLLRVSTVIPRPGLPTEYQVIGNLGNSRGCPTYSLDGRFVGFVAGSTGNAGRSRGFRIVGGRVERTTGGGSGSPTRILAAETVAEFLADPSRFARRDSWLGVSGLQALTKPLSEALGIDEPGGLVVGEVEKLSPAEAAGFAPGDVIVAWGEERIDTKKDRDVASFSKKVRRAKAGGKVAVKVLRSGDEGYAAAVLETTIEEAPLSENEVPDYQDKDFGLKLKPLTRDFLKQARLPLDSKGVRVTSVESASWAYLAGIRGGDVLQKMVLKPCPDLPSYKAIMKSLMRTRDSEVCYNVLRQRKSLFLCVRPDWETVPEVKED